MNDMKFLSENLLLKVIFYISSDKDDKKERFAFINSRKIPSTPKLMWAISRNMEEEVKIYDIKIKNINIVDVDTITKEELDSSFYLSEHEEFDEYRFFIIFYKSESVRGQHVEGYISLITQNNKFPNLNFIKRSIISTNKQNVNFEDPLITNIMELTAKDYFDFYSNE